MLNACIPGSGFKIDLLLNILQEVINVLIFSPLVFMFRATW